MSTATLLSPEDLAARLGKSADYWARRARAKGIPHRRVGASIRFTEDDYNEIVAGMRVDPIRSTSPRSRAPRR